VRFVSIVSALIAATLLALGLGELAPMGGGLATLCDLAGIVSAIMFLGLSEGA
jgi:hypothetical protein